MKRSTPPAIDNRKNARKNPTNLQHPRGGPQQLLVIVTPHDPNQLDGALGSKDDQLALLVTVGQDLKAIGDDGQEFDVVPLQQSDHLLQTTGQSDGHLGTVLVEQQVVQGGDGVEENAFDWATQQFHQGRNASALEYGQ